MAAVVIPASQVELLARLRSADPQVQAAVIREVVARKIRRRRWRTPLNRWWR